MSDYGTGQKILDLEGAMTRLDGDRELFNELIQIFTDECPSQLQAIDAALAKGDLNELEHAAHSIKGALGNIGAMVAYQLSYSLEKKGKARDASGAPELFTNLKEAIVAFQAAVAALPK